MAERMVQVPVSLVNDAAYSAYQAGADVTGDRLRALLSPPTPSAEPVWSVVLVKRGGHYRYVKVVGGDWDAALESAENANEGWEALQAGPFVPGNGVAYHSTITATQPRFEDMAPGTTFWARTRDGVLSSTDRLWFVDAAGYVFSIGAHHIDAQRIDPSTIRDVTPPKEQP